MITGFTWLVGKRPLEPGDSLSEILFGLLMTLTFTLGAGLLLPDDPKAARQLLFAILGCNLAWGIIDAVFYIGAEIYERGRRSLIGQRIRLAESDEAAAAIVREELDEMIGRTVDAEERADLYLRMAHHVRASEAHPIRLVRADFYGAITSFWLVFFATIPATLPFFLVGDAWRALRISNAILVSLLFVAGYYWARYTALPPWLTGLAFTVTGVGLVAIAISLGG